MADDDINPDTSMLTGPDGLITPGEATLRGLDGADLRAACAAGALVRVHLGVYADAGRWAALDATGRYRLRVLAAGRRLRRAVFSHDSAAALWRLPRLGPWPDAVHVSVPAGAPGRSCHDVRCHRTQSFPDHVVSVSGVRMTGVTRTVVDLARSWSFGAGLVTADHALREGWTTRSRLERELVAVGPGPGTRNARRVVGAVTHLSESPGESFSRARMLEQGLPLPALQQELSDESGQIGRVDFWWEELGLVGEFDGRLTHRADGITGQGPGGGQVWAEKRREARLRAAGFRIVRWTWDDLLAPRRLAGLLVGAGLRP